MSDPRIDPPVLERGPVVRPLETVIATTLLLFLLFSTRDGLSQVHSASTLCAARVSENQAIPATCGQRPNHRNS